MRRLIIILFLQTSLTTFGQTCDTIEGRQINCIDSIGQKQGYWKERKKILIHSSDSDLSKYLTLAEGLYKDNKKISIWKYYGDNDHLIYVERKITFYPNGAIKEQNLPDNSVIEFNKDTSVVTGYIYYKGDTITLNCMNKKGTFKLNHDREILTFDFTDFDKFDNEFLRLKIGMYDRKIKEIKTNR